MKKLSSWLAAVSSFFVGCDPTPDTPLNVTQPTATNSRISVTRIGVFEDDLAYGNRRAIYVIRDNETEREFIGISGIGISELGSHTAGGPKNRHSVSDER